MFNIGCSEALYEIQDSTKEQRHSILQLFMQVAISFLPCNWPSEMVSADINKVIHNIKAFIILGKRKYRCEHS